METIETPHGEARAHITAPDGPPRGLLVLGHGAGGGVGARDLQAAADAASAAGFSVALVEQPWRVEGRKVAVAPERLDVAWAAVLADPQLKAVLHPRGGRLVVGGRSAGARVACRTAADTGAVGLLCLAFPLHPPGRPESSRLEELDGVQVPVLVVQGKSDPFGMPPAGPGRVVVTVAGNHSLTSDLEAVRSAVAQWLAQVR